MLFAAIQVGIKWGYCKQLLSQKSWQISRITVLHGRFVVGRCRHVVNFVWYILYNFREDGAVAEGAFHLAEVPVDTSRDYSRYLFGLFAFCFVGHGLFKLVNKSLKLVNFTA
nr:uncharacterized protein LOC104099065 isoform X2 [Nicotiana tomentosiformis]